MTTLMEQAPGPASRPSLALACLAILSGAGTAIGVPWAVFRYGTEVGISATEAWVLALIGIVGGVLVLLRATGRTRTAP